MKNTANSTSRSFVDPEFGATTNYSLYEEKKKKKIKSKPKKKNLDDFESASPTTPRISTFNPFSVTDSDPTSNEVSRPKQNWLKNNYKTVVRVIEVIFIIGFFILMIFLVIKIMDLYTIIFDTYPPNEGSGPLTCHLIGDSLINKPYSWYNLPDKINYFVNYQFNFSNFASNGQEIAAIAAGLPQALNPVPDTVILFWDSDVSNVNEYAMSQEQIQITRNYYIANLTYVINTTLSAGVKYMGVAGPGVLGENYFLKKHYFWRKIDMLNEYRDMNQNVSAHWNVSYIDVRHEYLRELPWYWAYYMWFITRDGEHENARGTRYVSELFGNALRGWLEGYNATLLEQNN